MRAPTAREIAATARAEAKRRRDYLLAIARYLDMLAEDGTLMRLDAGVLRQQRDEVQELADRISVQLRSRSWLHFGLLQAAENAGADLGYTSPNKGKPHGPGIDYLVTAAAKHGYPIGPDRAHAVIVTYNALPRVSAKLGGEIKIEAHALVLRKGSTIDE